MSTDVNVLDDTRYERRVAFLEAKTKEFAEGEARYNAAYKAMVEQRDELEQRERKVAAREQAIGKVEELEGRLADQQARHEAEVNTLRRQVQDARQSARKPIQAAIEVLQSLL